MLLVHKIRLYPDKRQIQFFEQCSGVARFAYNWAIDEWKRQYDSGKKLTEAKLRKHLNSIKAIDYPWMLSVPKNVPQQAIKNVGIAFKNFFRRVKNGEKPGYPKFKKRGVSKDSFKPDNGSTKTANALKIEGKKVRIPKLGFVKMAERVRFDGKIIGSTISRTADKWFISITINTNVVKHVRKNQGSCGIDVGVNCLAALDNGKKYQPAKALKKHEKKLQRLARQLSKKQKDSANRKKANIRLSRLHYKIACIRSDVLHKASTDIVLNNSFIAMETLNVKGMVKNHKLAKAISDASISEFQRQILYKAEMYESYVHKIDRWFPSTKLCMSCGTLHDMPLGKRTFRCSCGVPDTDRDVHAAQNIIGQALAELTPVETKALAHIMGETIVNETGTDNVTYC